MIHQKENRSTSGKDSGGPGSPRLLTAARTTDSKEISMPSYALFDNVHVTDPDALNQYKTAVLPVVERFGGRYIVVGGEWETLEGDWSPISPVMIEFPDMAAARAWYHSDDYRPLRDLHQRAAAVNAVLLGSPQHTTSAE
jgi:uncharacterized protein (DUF1330 family)